VVIDTPKKINLFNIFTYVKCFLALKFIVERVQGVVNGVTCDVVDYSHIDSYIFDSKIKMFLIL
jgi:hypothetical protein